MSLAHTISQVLDHEWILQCRRKKRKPAKKRGKGRLWVDEEGLMVDRP
jgi:hypothetical protein